MEPSGRGERIKRKEAIVRSQDWIKRVDEVRTEYASPKRDEFRVGDLEIRRLDRVLERKMPIPIPNQARNRSARRWYELRCAFFVNPGEREYLDRLADSMSHLSLSEITDTELFDPRYLRRRPAPGFGSYSDQGLRFISS